MPSLIRILVRCLQYKSHIIVAKLTNSIGTEVIISPPSIYLIPLSEILRKDIKIAAQNCYCKSNGAYTGEIRFAVFRE